MRTLLCLLALIAVACAEVAFEEKFDDTWESRWVVSDWKKDKGEAGEWKHTAGKFFKDESDKGIQTTPDARFYAISAKLPKPFSNKGKDLVFQFQVKHEQKIDCGGGYMKLLAGDVDQKNFGGDTPYEIMFGPDICGYSTKRVHAIITHEGVNMLTKKSTDCETDELSHVYTFVLSSNNTYKIFIDTEEKASGSIFEDWDFLKPKQIPDASVTKPEDWVDDEFMNDPEDKKPAGWDDIPAEVIDPEAKKPEDWNEEDDGEWEAPMIPNPDYKGEWEAKRIKNPAYKGVWAPPMIDNPEYVDKPEAYVLPDITHVGMELWQVKAGSIFDNVLITDDVNYALEFAQKTWGDLKEAEKLAFDEAEKKRQEEEEKNKKDLEDDADDADDEEPEDGEDLDEDKLDDEEAEASKKDEL